MVKTLKEQWKLTIFAHRKRDDFMWAGLVEFIEGIFLPMSFAAAINTSTMAFISAAVGVNNVFSIVIDLTLFLTPIMLTWYLLKGWKENKALATAAEQREGGEQEEKKKQTKKGKKIKNGKKKKKGKKGKAKKKKQSAKPAIDITEPQQTEATVGAES